MAGRGRRASFGKWRQRVIKHYLHRTITFQMRAKTPEELKAWSEVEKWFRAILNKGYSNEHDVIVLPKIYPEELEKKEI